MKNTQNISVKLQSEASNFFNFDFRMKEKLENINSVICLIADTGTTRNSAHT